MDIRERVLHVAELKGIKISELERRLSLSRSYFRNTKSVSADAIARLLVAFPDISADWLLTGQGEMLRQPSEQSEPSEPSAWSSFISLIADEVRRRMRDE